MPDVDGDSRAGGPELCQALIRVDTTNPPGREMLLRTLRDRLEAAGVDCELAARDRPATWSRASRAWRWPSLAFVGH
jgi:hypothetical protein